MWPFNIKEEVMPETKVKHKLYYWCKYYIKDTILVGDNVEEYEGNIRLAWFSANGTSVYISKRDKHGRIIKMNNLQALDMIIECATAEGNHDVVNTAKSITTNPKPHYSWFVSQDEGGNTYD